jgi:hypothetical protein
VAPEEHTGEPLFTFLRTWVEFLQFEAFQSQFARVNGHSFQDALQSFGLFCWCEGCEEALRYVMSSLDSYGCP